MAVSTPVPASKSERTPNSTPGGTKAKEEKIVVTVRLRPLNKRELSSRDQVAWECLDKQTIVFRPPPQDHSLPASFTFDRIFGPDSLTECIYDESIKTVALSALRGINSTIFAYGQTSSGKTYTMRGITEKVVGDLYKHIMNTPERDFTIKISGLEIYNENVKDLLNSESGRNLKLLDDPEKGTVVEKLVEEMATGEQHLKHMIGICESQRQVGETSLNDTSSRSHQIIRLIIESTQRQNSECIKSYLASLNLVDLAGSERASQTNTDGVRLREGCHINLSLMTLTTVIRKLSVGKRCGHVPYRDSKLTRILQHSLGGNARTAIICTLSPALAHVEQSRNTLSFATRAKEVTNNAQVNMVVSEKQLVKQLKKEVARLEAELRTPDTSKEKNDLMIQQMLIEIEEKELKNQQMRLEMEEKDSTIQKMKMEIEQLRHKTNSSFLSDDVSEKATAKTTGAAKCLSFSAIGLTPRKRGKGEEGVGAVRMSRNAIRQSSTVPLILVNEIRKLERQQQQLGDEANRAVEVLQKQVACHREGNQDAAETIAKLQAEISEMRSVRPPPRPPHTDHEHSQNSTAEACASLKEEITRLHTQGSTIDNLERQLESMQRCIDKLTMSIPLENKKTMKKKRRSPLGSTNPPNKKRSPCSQSSSSPPPPPDSDSENREPDMATEEKTTPGSKDDVPCYQRSGSVGMKKMKRMFENAAEENVRGIRTYVTELKERVAKLQYQKHLLVCQVLEMEGKEEGESLAEEDEREEEGEEEGGRVPWEVAFREQRQEIVELWHACHVSIVHRSQFYLLFRGDSTDQIYMEVELRRLTWLQQHFSGEGGGGREDVAAAAAVSVASSMKALKREREVLAKRMGTHMSAEEREGAYRRWGVAVDGKHRRMQVIGKLWRETGDGRHVEESAEMVARLVGFEGAGEMPKEMFELNFATPADRRPWLMGWNHLSTLLHL